MAMSALTASLLDGPDAAYEKYVKLSDGNYVDTQAAIASALRAKYPSLNLTTCDAINHDLIGFANAGKATISVLDPNSHCVIRSVSQPSRKVGGLDIVIRPSSSGVIHQVDEESRDATEDEDEHGKRSFSNRIKFGRYLLKWDDQEYLVYLVDGLSCGHYMACYYILCEASLEDEKQLSSKAIDRLMYAAASWAMESQDEILVFNQGRWGKDKELFKNVQSTSWDDVILESSMKSSLIKDVEGFFGAENIYKDFNVPWKRGIILHGEPGNGKTLSLRALMHGLQERTPAIPTLYVKTFEGAYNHQVSIRDIFTKARLTAPCLLIFEDIDSLVVERVRSYFLNEVDGLEDNDGILIVATTNHLEKLDPALAHRPSRFDKKYHLLCPKKPERVLYCRFWRETLLKKSAYAFPEVLYESIADITEGFSFAYLKELFLSTLLSLARDESKTLGGEDVENLETLIFWQRIQIETELLRKDLDAKVQAKAGKVLGAGPAAL